MRLLHRLPAAALCCALACQEFLGNDSRAPAPAASASSAPPSMLSEVTLRQPEPLPPVASSAPSPEPDPVPPGVTPSPDQTRGTLPKAVIAQVLDGANPDFSRCMEAGLKRKPGLSGHINLNFVIAPDGNVPYAAALEQGTDLKDEAVVECVLKVVQGLKFPEPRGGRVVVTHPLSFVPTP